MVLVGCEQRGSGVDGGLGGCLDVCVQVEEEEKGRDERKIELLLIFEGLILR